MVNIQTAVRLQRITEIYNMLVHIKKEGMEVDKKRFLFEICFKYGVTERKAKEYIDVARIKLDYGQQKL